ncbi:nucleotidyltransferase family protein [bacterium]|nr:nucleotidyltransferase family protein [bacterium]
MRQVNRNEVVKQLNMLFPNIKKKFKANSILLFGSVARGENRIDSDIDVLVDFKKGADLFDLMGLADYLEHNLHHKVDVVSKNGLREELRSIVEKEAIAI